VSKLVLAAALFCAGGNNYRDFCFGPGIISAELSYEQQQIGYCNASAYVYGGKPGRMGIKFRYMAAHLMRTLRCDTRDGIMFESEPVVFEGKGGH